MSRARSLAVACVGAVFAILTLGVDGYAQTLEDQLRQAQRRLDEARTVNLNLIAPDHFDKAARSLDEAARRFEQGGGIEDIRKRIVDAHRELDKANALLDFGAPILRDAVEARDDALASNAPEFAPKLWEDAEKSLRKAGEGIQGGKPRAALTDAERARGLYRDAELQAIHTDVLGTARSLRRTAVELKADRLAPKTLSLGDGLLDEAERVLQGDRYQRAEARDKAEDAAEAFRHAARLAETIEVLNKSGREAGEELILKYEEQLQRIAEAFDFEPHFSEGTEAVTEQILAAIESTEEDRQILLGKLSTLQEEKAELEARLVPLEASEAELRRKQRRDQTFREVQATFTRAEGEVLTTGDQLIIRLYGLSFPSGSAEIRPENFSLLTKVQRVLREFPKVPVTVEGHTDAVGNDTFNLSLSQKRANAVREYLLANLETEPDWISAIGYGEEEPVASNETAEGRAKNRRIDIVIDWVI